MVRFFFVTTNMIRSIRMMRCLILWIVVALQACSWTSEYNRADKLMREGKFYSAIEYYLSFVQKNPDHPRAPLALLEVGKLQENILDDVDQAIVTYRSLVNHYPVNNSTVLAQEKLAQIFKNKKGNYNQALTEFDKLLRAVPSHADAPSFQMELSDCYTLLHQYQQADLEYETLIERYPRYAKLDEVFFKKANNNYIAGSYAKALDDYKKIIEGFPDSKYKIEALFGLGSTYEELDEFELAKKFYEQVKDRYPSPQVVEIRLQGLKKRKASKKI